MPPREGLLVLTAECVAVVVLNYNNYPTVLETIRDVGRQTAVSTSLLFVDNGDARAKVADVLADAEAVLRLAHNGGYADGMNRGLRALPASAYEYVLLLTHDVRLPEPSTLHRMLSYMRANPEVGVCGPSLRTPDGGVWSTGGQLTKWTMSGRHIKRAEASSQAADVAWLDGSCLLYRSTALAAVGNFDTQYFLYVEELDHHYRLRRHGFAVRCLTQLEAVQSTNGTPPYYASRNQVLFLRKQRMVGRAVLMSCRVLARSAYLMLRPDRRAEVRPMLHGLTHGWLHTPLRQRPA